MCIFMETNWRKTMKKKKRYTSEEKTLILREHLENQVPISELSERYGVHPNAVYTWKKQMFEASAENFGKKRKLSDKELLKAEKLIEELEKLLSKRESLITELVEDNIKLKKNLSGESLTKNGLNRKLGMNW